jgi:hypothetical protein
MTNLIGFSEIRKFFKKISKIFFVKTEHRIISFPSHARLSKIEVLESILEHFEIFRFSKIFRKNSKLVKFEEIFFFKFQNALKSLIFNILCSNRRTELQIGIDQFKNQKTISGQISNIDRNSWIFIEFRPIFDSRPENIFSILN